MESAEITLKNLSSQPRARLPRATFEIWRTSVLNQLTFIDANRSAEHHIARQVSGAQAFLKEQCAKTVRAAGDEVEIDAGRFYWFLCRLLARQERMKVKLSDGDPFTEQLDPVLRGRIKGGFDLLVGDEMPAFWKLRDELAERVRVGRKKAKS